MQFLNAGFQFSVLNFGPAVFCALTDDPLDPDDVVASSLGHKVLQALAEVVPHPLAVGSQVPLGFVQELPRHVHHVHRVEQRQQQPFGDPPDAGAAVQGAAFARLALCFLWEREGLVAA